MKTQCPPNRIAELPLGVLRLRPKPRSAVSVIPPVARHTGAIINQTFLVALVALLWCTFSRAGLASERTPLNGSSPRPFYVIAHNTDKLAEVEDALGAGANALGPDIGALDPCQPGNSSPLRVMHSDPCDGIGQDDLTLDAYLDGVHNLVVTKFPNLLSLIVFDVKPSAANPARGVQILNSIRNHLNTNGVQIPVIISVAKTNDGAVFDNIVGKLGPLEGVMVDEEDNADQILKFFVDKGFGENIAYGDGSMGPGYELPRALDKGAWLRAATGFPRFTYVYTLNHISSMHSFIDGGVDGILPDVFSADSHYGGSSYIKDLLGVVTNHSEIRLATPADNPFHPALESYGLEILTSDIADAGTDAHLTFTLKGCRGVSSNTVDTGSIYVGYDTARMRKGNTDWTTMPSKDLGNLKSIVIRNDGGIQNGWHLKEIRVSSARYLGPNWGHAREYVASFNGWIYKNTTVEIPLVPNFPEPLPTIQCPAPITVANDANQCGAAVSFAPVVDGPCDDVTAVCSPASGTVFPVGQTMVTCYATNASSGSAPCTFTVTVEDTQLPVIACPAPMVVNATSPAGAVVPFAVQATDNCGVTVVSTPASGSVFAIGDTLVQSTATDGSANQASCSFNVHVKGAAEQTADLLTAVNSLNLSKLGVKSALLFQLNATLASLQSNNLAAACGSLQSFIDLIEAQRNKAISPNDADLLIAAAIQIRAVMGCTP